MSPTMLKRGAISDLSILWVELCIVVCWLKKPPQNLGGIAKKDPFPAIEKFYELHELKKWYIQDVLVLLFNYEKIFIKDY